MSSSNTGQPGKWASRPWTHEALTNVKAQSAMEPHGLFLNCIKIICAHCEFLASSYLSIIDLFRTMHESDLNHINKFCKLQCFSSHPAMKRLNLLRPILFLLIQGPAGPGGKVSRTQLQLVPKWVVTLPGHPEALRLGAPQPRREGQQRQLEGFSLARDATSAVPQGQHREGKEGSATFHLFLKIS